jgi:hypothetical protein
MIKVIMAIVIGLLRQRPQAPREVEVIDEHPNT